MLRWLDSNSNRKAQPNENFARELMELFTLGVGNYTENDVREAARAFTGWFFDPKLGFVFNQNQHDDGDKTVLSQTGPWNGDDVITILFQQPTTATFLATKLFKYFVHDDPSPSTIAALAAASGMGVLCWMRREPLTRRAMRDGGFLGLLSSRSSGCRPIACGSRPRRSLASLHRCMSR